MDQHYNGLEIAVIGLAGRFPGASSIPEYWDNLKHGIASIRRFTDQELQNAGISSSLLRNPEYVKAKGYIEGTNHFDFPFFEYTPLEAEIMDPQLRIFHEVTWEALEDAGYAAKTHQQLVGLFAGASPNHMWEGLMSLSGMNEQMGPWAAAQLLDKDYLSMRVAHKLNLKGPVLSLYTACSTSLTAVHMASQSLLNGECDLALAGGVTITLPDQSGYMYQEGMILSPDGACRAFDADGKGIVGGDGAGVVALKRLSEAMEDGDHIYAVIKGSAVNNDGLHKTGFTAPGTLGQAEVIRTALKVAEIDPGTVGYIECHGTGTPLGDPIELEALEMAYSHSCKSSCAIGSVKTNIGHLDSAAGIASFIKTVLAVKHGMIPPTLNFGTPNPEMNLVGKGFYVNERLADWSGSPLHPLRAGVSSFGIGGTNAHVIIEQAPRASSAAPASSTDRDWELLPLSARTDSSLHGYKLKLSKWLETEPDPALADIAYTLQTARKHFGRREFVLCDSRSSASRFLDAGQINTHSVNTRENLRLLYHIYAPGALTLNHEEREHIVQLCRQEPMIARIVEQGLQAIRSIRPAAMSYDLLTGEHPLDDALAQSLAFVVNFAISKWLIQHSGVPAGLSGSGKGAWLAACVANVISLEEAVRVVLENKELDSGFPCGFSQPAIPLVSPYTGDWLNVNEELTDPDYWNNLLYSTDYVSAPWSTAVLDSRTLCVTLGMGSLPESLRNDLVKNNTPIVKLEKASTYSIMYVLGELWQFGATVQWEQLYTKGERRPVSLPGYVFDRHEIPLQVSPRQLEERLEQSKPTVLQRNARIQDWFYVPGWESSVLPDTARVVQSKPSASPADWLIFGDTLGLGQELAAQLKLQGSQYVLVEQGDSFIQLSDTHYLINPQSEADMRQLLEQQYRIPDHICYLWAVTPASEPSSEDLAEQQQLYFHQILELARGIGVGGDTRSMRLQIVSNDMYTVTYEEAVNPVKALLLGAVKIIPLEYPNLDISHADIYIGEGQSRLFGSIAQQLIKEFDWGLPHQQVAFRGRSRWVSAVKKAEMLQVPGHLPLLHNNMVCLITGGLGGMGFTLAGFLAVEYKARLILVGRSSFPSRSEWEAFIRNFPHDPLSAKIRNILSWEKSGAEIEICCADISDQDAMEQIVRKAEERWGTIHGILHTAGVPDLAGVIQRRTKEMSDAVLLPKVQGTLALDRLFRNRKLEFFILFSSIGNYIYGRKFGQVGYNAANEFIEAYAEARSMSGEGYVAAISWNDWAEVGMSVNAIHASKASHKKVDEVQFAEEAISPQQGVDVFRYVLQNRLNRAIISVSDLPELMRNSNSRDIEQIMEQEAEAMNQNGTLKPTGTSPQKLSRKEWEEELADIWSSVLGKSPTGRKDDFFELGGDSLKAITIISVIYKRLNVKIPLPVFLKSPTLKDVTRYINNLSGLTYASITPAPDKVGYRLTSAQQRLYILQQMEQETKQYNNLIGMRVTGDLDYELLERCLVALTQRHESLRTSFKRLNGELLQVIEDRIEAPPYYLDTEEGRLEVDTLIQQWNEPFDLGQAPLFKVAVCKENNSSHIVVFNIHHIISDGTSNAILMREFTELYTRSGQSDRLPLLSVQYKDYAEWQSRQGEEDAAIHQEYWLSRYTGEIPVLDLAADFSRPSIKTYRGDIEWFDLDKTCTDSIRQLAADHEVTLYMVLFTAWNVLLARLSNQEDIVVGVPASGRNHSDIQQVIGMFVNTLPIRSNVSMNATFRDLLSSMKENITHALEHQDYPFEDLVGNLQIQRDFGRNPLFDVMFAFQNTNIRSLDEESAPADLLLSSYDLASDTSRFDMTLDGEENENGIKFHLEYSTDLFRKDTIQRRITYFKRIIQEILRNPEITLKAIPLVDEQEAEQLLRHFNATQLDYPSDKLVHQLFEEQAERYPDRAAWVVGGQTITYGELDAKANRVARYLQAKGLVPDSRVALITSRSLDMIVGMMAVLKAGGAYLPIDPQLPNHRISNMLADCAPLMILTNTDIGLETTYETIHLQDQVWSTYSSDPLSLCNSSRDLSYCIYTSGTTGRPKGIAVEHRSLINFAYAMDTIFPWTDGEQFLSLTTVSFDIFWLESMLPLLRGCTVVMATEDEQSDMQALVQQIARQRVTVLQMTPSRLKLLLTEPAWVEQLGSIRYLLIGGEVFSGPLLAQAQQQLGHVRIYNMYGPTETTIWSTCREVTRDVTLNIGHPIRNTMIYIVNEGLQLQPIGVPGDLYIAGEGLARGYWNRPDLTEDKFRTNPFRTGEKMYSTGDLAVWRDDGTIDFLGRQDAQIKLRGFRIELTEVEAILDNYPAIGRAAAAIRSGAREEDVLVAYYTAEHNVDNDELREYLSGQLPDYMLPQQFMRISHIPLMISGKLDRKALPQLSAEPDLTDTDVSVERETCTDAMERQIYSIWHEVLGSKQQMGVRNRFFELGGNSIQAMQLVYEIQTAFGVPFAFKHFIQLQTIEAMARYIRGQTNQRTDELPPIIPDIENLYEPFPLTNVQMAYYLGRSSQFELGGVSTHAYQELTTRLDVNRLNECLNQLIQRHPMLRTVFLENARQQILAEVPHYRIPVHDLRDTSEAHRLAVIEQERERMSHHMFDPMYWPLFDVSAFRLSEKEHMLCISFDLLIMDAFSLDIISRELSVLYDGKGETLEDLPITFRDYMQAYDKLKDTPSYTEDKAYWMGKLEQFPQAPTLPLQTHPSAIKKPYFQRKSMPFSRSQWESLKQISRQHNLTPSTVLCTAYAEVLSHWSNQTDFSMNLTLFNRVPLHPAVDKLVGDFTSLLLLELHLEAELTFWEKASRVHSTLMEALSHRHFDGIDMMRELSKNRERGSRALMPIVFTSALFEHSDQEHTAELIVDTDEDSDAARQVNGITQTSQVYLDNQVVLINGKMIVNWDYISELFDPMVIDTMFGQYVRLLESIMEQTTEIPLPALSEADEACIWTYNNTGEEIPDDTLHGLFGKMVVESPYAVAIEDDDTTMTYRELDEKSSRVGSLLQASGIGPGDLIAVTARKEAGTFVNIIGILKCGAAYVPVDPEYPQERISYMLQHSCCKLQLDPDYYERYCAHASELSPLRIVHNPEGLAYVIYTSGSTGQPKGVMIRHQAVCNTVMDINHKFGVSSDDRILGISSLCFDLSVYDMFGALASGATLVLHKQTKNIAQLVRSLIEQRITVWNSVPALMDRALSEIAELNSSHTGGMLRLVMLSGDWIPLNLPERISRYFPSAEVISLGGATEASIWSIFYPVRKNEAEWTSKWTSIPYGMPMANQRWFVLNPNMQFCPPGVQGELYIAGTGLADGYLNDPGKTKEAFIRHPRLGEVYKTGDYGVMHRNGLIEFRGRKDQQVKISGYRIELGEIEGRLLSCENIRQAVVLAAGTYEKRLYAYLVPKDEQETPQTLINQCRTRLSKELPDYMIPYYFTVIGQLPLTPNAKVDVHALLRLNPAEQGRPITYTAPRNPVEVRIVLIFTEILETDRVSVTDNFFDMGLDSIQIAMVHERLKREFNRDIPILSLFEYATIDALSMYLGQDSSEDADKVQEEWDEEKMDLISKGRDRRKQRSDKRRMQTEDE